MSYFADIDIITVYKYPVTGSLFEKVYRLFDDEPPEAIKCLIHLEESHLAELINIKNGPEKEGMSEPVKRERF